MRFPSLREAVQNWLDHWPVPEYSDDLVLEGPLVVELAKALGLDTTEQEG